MFNQDKYPEVPDRTLETFDMWAKKARPPGSFARACLQNDLMEAVNRADQENQEVIARIMDYVYNELPARCWGDANAVAEWEQHIKEIGTMKEQEVS